MACILRNFVVTESKQYLQIYILSQGKCPGFSHNTQCWQRTVVTRCVSSVEQINKG